MARKSPLRYKKFFSDFSSIVVYVFLFNIDCWSAIDRAFAVDDETLEKFSASRNGISCTVPKVPN